uniref:FBA_1 domain-containing protein n=1 Tax=Steinernema glaseri TaxID=37863 RepID=A0A1I8ACM2_9BILA
MDSWLAYWRVHLELNTTGQHSKIQISCDSLNFKDHRPSLFLEIPKGLKSSIYYDSGQMDVQDSLCTFVFQHSPELLILLTSVVSESSADCWTKRIWSKGLPKILFGRGGVFKIVFKI